MTNEMTTNAAPAYNGWTNYETWAVHLWLANEQGLESTARELVATNTDDFAAMALRHWIEEMAPTVTGMFGDLITHALSRVDWPAIVAAFRE